MMTLITLIVVLVVWGTLITESIYFANFVVVNAFLVSIHLIIV